MYMFICIKQRTTSLIYLYIGLKTSGELKIINEVFSINKSNILVSNIAFRINTDQKWLLRSLTKSTSKPKAGVI